MKSQKLGKNTLAVEIQNISHHGLWLLVHDQEYFLPRDDFPWFAHATIDKICNVELLLNGHLHWPDLDIDLALDSLENLEKYPLKYA